MSVRKSLVIWALIIGSLGASFMLFAAAEARRDTAANAAKDAAWMTKMEAEMEKVGP
ncbi:hypothetical protein [Pseudomonas sp.]|uniref:hypothetical protein n=1 Tax=Pseudomonas sp. TaxID=306 RepID=UPI003D1474AE